MRTILTLDYEMFNGPCGGTIKNCMLKPTEMLCKILDRHNFRATFFIDVCFLLKLRSLKDIFVELQDDWDAVVLQLQQLSAKGHDLEIHIHPNWHRALYENGRWIPSLDDYKLSDVPLSTVMYLFKEGINLLKEITGKQPIAFRAGAYCIQTFNLSKDFFAKYGICIDSSVFRNRCSITDKYEWYDYLNIPREYTYNFSVDVCKKSENGRFIEVSIPSYKIPAWRYHYYRFKAKMINPMLLKRWGDGVSSIGGTMLPYFQKIRTIIKRNFGPRFVPASVDGFNAIYLDFLYSLEANKGDVDYFLIMGHPKLITPYSLDCLDTFLNKRSKKIINFTIDSFYTNVAVKD